MRFVKTIIVCESGKINVLDKTGSLPVSFPAQIIYRIVSYARCKHVAVEYISPKGFQAGSLTIDSLVNNYIVNYIL